MMKNFKRYAFSALLVGALALPIASAKAEESANNAGAANASGAITSQTFKSLDSDKSGTLSESEFSKFSEANIEFDKVDANGDGRLTLSEAQTIPAAPPKTPSMAN